MSIVEASHHLGVVHANCTLWNALKWIALKLTIACAEVVKYLAKTCTRPAE